MTSKELTGIQTSASPQPVWTNFNPSGGATPRFGTNMVGLSAVQDANGDPVPAYSSLQDAQWAVLQYGTAKMVMIRGGVLKTNGAGAAANFAANDTIVEMGASLAPLRDTLVYAGGGLQALLIQTQVNAGTGIVKSVTAVGNQRTFMLSYWTN